MPDLGLFGWIIIGFFAGALSGMIVGDRTARGCLPNILVGVVGGVIGGLIARELFNQEQTIGWIASFVVAFIGAILVRLALRLVNPR